MLHSQSLNEKPLYAWVVAEKEGTILTGHCTCRAGLGEVCSHVAATLFATEATVKIRDATTVTQSKAYWLLPAGIQKIDYRPVKDIDFRSAKTQKRHLDELIDSLSDESKRQKLDLPSEDPHTVLHTPFSKGPRNIGSSLPVPPTAQRTRKQSTSGTPPPTHNELNNFYATLKGTGTKPVILSLVDGYQEDYIPVTQTSKFPKLFSELREQKSIEMDKPELMSRCEEIFSDLKVTAEEAQNVEIVTKKQTGCKEWFRFRSGRITASKFKAVCRTSIETPSQSLLKSICYPVTVKFKTEATKWGCEHEKLALEQYQIEMCNTHDGLVLEDSGLINNPEYPHLGASPDAVVVCDCCGEGCVEVKCPFCLKDKKLDDCLEKRSCLELRDGKLKLRKCHEYYYQVQCQLFVSKKDYCDFVIWTNEDFHSERIEPDNEFWNEASNKAREFFVKVVLLELVGKYYSRPASYKPQDIPGTSGAICKDTENIQSKTQISQPPKPKKSVTTKKKKTVVNDQHRKKCESNVLKSLDNSNLNTQNIHNDSFQGKVCVCQMDYDPEFDDVIGCDNENCPYIWLHYSCIKLESAPDGDWYCPSCRTLPQFKNL